jgi:hypothetical protein
LVETAPFLNRATFQYRYTFVPSVSVEIKMAQASVHTRFLVIKPEERKNTGKTKA